MKKKVIRLNKDFYQKDAIIEAISDFSEVCSGKIITQDKNQDIIVELQPLSDDIQNLEEEFCNYVLGLMKNKTMI